MIKVYINYPQPHITIHCDPICRSIQAQNKPNQRYLKINPSTIARELQNFSSKKYTFAANPDHNDMWLEIELHDANQEKEVLQKICHIIGNYYRPLRGVEPKTHCY